MSDDDTIRRALEPLNDHLRTVTTVRGAFEAYRIFLLRDAGPVQVAETRKAFYAGADWILKRIMDGPEDEEAATRALGAMLEELQQFGARGGRP